MKKLILLLFFIILLTACGPKSMDVINSWLAALNKGDVDAALSQLAEGATVTIIPPAEGDGIYNGHAEIRGWYESMVAAKGSGSLKDCKVDGETITCHNTYADDGLKAMGVDFIEGTWIAIVRDGKIQSYTFTITPESLAKFPPPPEPVPSAPVETLAGSINDVLGTWWSPQAGVQYTLKADGMYRVFANSETVDEGTYAFENGRITWLTSTVFCVDNPTATYDVYVTKENGKPAWIRMEVVGSDLCKGRAETTKNKDKYMGP